MVSLELAEEVVERWQLDGRPLELSCGCVRWIPTAGTGKPRLVRQCAAHRPSFLRRLIRNADRE